MQRTPQAISYRQALLQHLNANAPAPVLNRGERSQTFDDYRDLPALAINHTMRAAFPPETCCVNCYVPVASRAERLGMLKAYKALPLLAAEVARNAAQRPDANSNMLSEHRRDPGKIERVLRMGLDLASYGTSVKRDAMFSEPATFVWLYLLDKSDSHPKGEELRYSMRSVRENYNGKASFVVVGDKPAWYSGQHIEMPRVAACPRRRYRDTLNKMNAAVQSAEISDRFVWMMDDQYFMHPVAMCDLESNWYQGTIPAKLWGGPSWRGMQTDAYRLVEAKGKPRIDFCTHLPKTVEAAKWKHIWDEFDLQNVTCAWELLYGAEFYKHCRLIPPQFLTLVRTPAADIPESVIINNGTSGWNGFLHDCLAQRFPNTIAEECDAPRYRFELPAGYKENPANNNGVAVPDSAQRNVYQYASRLEGKRVIDLGTGSGSKLVEFFKDRETVGIDVAEKVRAARERFPERQWETEFLLDCDLLLCVDVLEHLSDPREMLRRIAAASWRRCVISTPERDKARGVNDFGPPANHRHVREWNTAEFVRLITRFVESPTDVRVLGRYNLLVMLERQ